MVSLDYSVWIQIANFLLLVYLLNVLLYKPVLGIIDKRKKQFEEAEQANRNLQESVERRMEEYETKLRLAKAAAAEKKNEIISQGAEEAKVVIDAVHSEIPVMMEQFHTRIDGEIAEARKILSRRSQQLSIEIAEKVLGRSLR